MLSSMHPEQVKIYRSMSPAKKLEIIESMYWEARELKTAALRKQRSDWPEEKIQKTVREIFLHANG